MTRLVWFGVALARMVSGHTPAPAHVPVFERLSVLFQVSTPSWRDELTSLLDRVPARKVRLVLFSLDGYGTLFREEDFHAGDLDRAAEAAAKALTGTVDYRYLRSIGARDLLANLVNDESRRGEPSEAVIFVAHWTRPMPGRFAPQELAPLPRVAGGALQKYFYIRYPTAIRQTCWEPCVDIPRGQPAPPDTVMCPCTMSLPGGMLADADIIRALTATLRGRTLNVRSPTDYDKAIRTMVGRNRR
jgi:hypothetical protein